MYMYIYIYIYMYREREILTPIEICRISSAPPALGHTSFYIAWYTICEYCTR